MIGGIADNCIPIVIAGAAADAPGRDTSKDLVLEFARRSDRGKPTRPLDLQAAGSCPGLLAHDVSPSVVNMSAYQTTLDRLHL